MVEFRKDGYSIHISVGYNPVEEWMELIDELLGIMALVDEQSLIKPWRTLNFLRDCLPDWEVAKRMVVVES